MWSPWIGGPTVIMGQSDRCYDVDGRRCCETQEEEESSAWLEDRCGRLPGRSGIFWASKKGRVEVLRWRRGKAER